MSNTKNRGRIGGGRLWGNPSILAEPIRIGLATNPNLYAYNYVTDYNKCYKMCKKVKKCNTNKCKKNCRKECR